MIDIVANDKECIPTITSSPAAAQSTTAPLKFLAVTLKTQDTIACSATAAADAVTKIDITDNNVNVGTVNGIGPLIATSSCTDTVTKGTNLLTSEVSDTQKIIILFCQTSGVCCDTDLCNGDPTITTTKSSASKTNLSLILILLPYFSMHF